MIEDLQLSGDGDRARACPQRFVYITHFLQVPKGLSITQVLPSCSAMSPHLVE
jgi:hypothetical protein